MSKLFENARIVQIDYEEDSSDQYGPTLRIVKLWLETDCPFHLSSVVSIPYECVDQIDIPVWTINGQSTDPKTVIADMTKDAIRKFRINQMRLRD